MTKTYAKKGVAHVADSISQHKSALTRVEN